MPYGSLEGEMLGAGNEDSCAYNLVRHQKLKRV